MFNIGMNDKELITHLGGPAKVAEMLSFEKEGGVQRVHNWIERGIPPRVKLDFPDIFLRPEFLEQVKQPTEPSTQQES